MSEIKKQAKLLKEKAKEFGYEIKHTHALELISQVTKGVNRHVALKENLKQKPNRFCLDDYEPAIKLPFGVEKHVIEIKCDDFIHYYITDSFGTMFEEIFDEEFKDVERLLYNVDSFRVMTKEDLEEEITLMNSDYENLDEPKKIIDRIIEKAEKTGLESFSLFTEYE